MPRILLITRNFPPLVGGMERLIQNLYKQLQPAYTVDLVGPSGCSEYVSKSDKAVESPVRPLIAFLASSFIKAVWLAIKSRHEVIFSGSGLTAPAAVFAGRLSSTPAITYIHGLDLIVDNRIYQHLFVPMIRLADLVIVNSHNTAQLAISAGIPADRIEVIHPGVDARDNNSSETDFRSRFDLHNKEILLSVGRLIPRKGIAEFILHSLPNIVASHPDAVLVVIGAEPEDALKKDASVLKQIKENISQTGLEGHVVLAGKVDDPILQAAYSEAELCIFPLMEVAGDVEGFGMVAIEAAAHGLPTIAFSVGGVVDAIDDGKTGFLIEPDDYTAFTDACINYLSHNYPQVSAASCKKFSASFHWDEFGKKINQSIEKIAQHRIK